MILTCPACDTKYVVKDGTIPAAGRQVRCAACKHSWHEPGDGAAAVDGQADSGGEVMGGPPQPEPIAATPMAQATGAAIADQQSAEIPEPEVPQPEIPGHEIPQAEIRADEAASAPGFNTPGLGSFGLGSTLATSFAPSLPASDRVHDEPQSAEEWDEAPPGTARLDTMSSGTRRMPVIGFDHIPAAAAGDGHPGSIEHPAVEPTIVEPGGTDPARVADPVAGPSVDDEDWSPAGRAVIGDWGHERAPPWRRSKLMLLLLVALLIAAAAAAFWFFAPDEWKARAGIAAAGASPLHVVITNSERQPLEQGHELVAISGRVINPTDQVQVVPPIHAELRNSVSRALIYQWTIAPPARSIAPRSSASFNSAEVDIPEGGDKLTLAWGAP